METTKMGKTDFLVALNNINVLWHTKVISDAEKQLLIQSLNTPSEKTLAILRLKQEDYPEDRQLRKLSSYFKNKKEEM